MISTVLPTLVVFCKIDSVICNLDASLFIFLTLLPHPLPSQRSRQPLPCHCGRRMLEVVCLTSVPDEKQKPVLEPKGL